MMRNKPMDARRASFFAPLQTPSRVEASGWGVFQYIFCKRKDLQIVIKEEDPAKE